MKLAYFTKYSSLGPSSRYRIFQFEPLYREAGVDLQLQVLFDDRFFDILRGPLPLLHKPAYVVSRFLKRRAFLAALQADVVVIEQQLFPHLPFSIEEKYLPPHYLLEFDDAIYLTHPRKMPGIIRKAQAVITGNQNLAEYARKFHSEVHVIPTVIDTCVYKSQERAPSGKIRIGWTGLEYNFEYLRFLSPVFQRLSENFPVEIVILSGSAPRNFDFPHRFVKWEADREVDQIREFDIGVMPLIDDEWSRGKCGMKLLQCMSLEIPCVASPVGVNREMIQDGRNGFLAQTVQEWQERLIRLVEDTDLRLRVGRAARQTIVEKYSVDVWFPRIVELLRRYA